MKDKYLVIDFKTTDLSEVKQAISGTILNQSGDILLDSIIKPCNSVDVRPIENFHNITSENIADYGIPFFEFLEKLNAIVLSEDYDYLVAYNLDFDGALLPKSLCIQKYCCMLLSTGFINNNPQYQSTSNYLKLNVLASLLDINFEDLDLLTSLGDAELCRRVWNEISNPKHNLDECFKSLMEQYQRYYS